MNGHVNQPFADHKPHVLLILREQGMKCRMKCLVPRSGDFLETVVGYGLDRGMLVVDMHVEHGENSVRVALDAIGLDGGAYGWLCEN